jgi:hypothetical protein
MFVTITSRGRARVRRAVKYYAYTAARARSENERKNRPIVFVRRTAAVRNRVCPVAADCRCAPKTYRIIARTGLAWNFSRSPSERVLDNC